MNTQTAPPAVFDTLLQKTLYCSRYARHVLEADSSVLDWLQENYAMPCSKSEMLDLLQHFKLDLLEESQLARALRILRKHVLIKLILRDLNGLADLNEVMQTMSTLAELCLQQAQQCLVTTLQTQYGDPIGATDQTTQQLLVVAMGKLGGAELNVSSDIDLIFIYPEDGVSNGKKSIGNHEYFTRLGQRLIKLINEPTADGYVFRVDMRLRPYGDSGPLVMSFAALEEYLISQGREWERYAWIKARVVTPANTLHAAQLMQLVQPFVFRKYLDFGAIDSMRSLHAQIRLEVQRRERQSNIKLGPGGIREIEFIAQVFQLIRGGNDARLRIRPTQAVLKQLADDQQLASQTVSDLNTAYVFLRNLEHRLQYLDDQQTQDIPDDVETRALLAQGMCYKDFAQLFTQLEIHRALVSQQFEQVFGTPPELQNELQLWREEITEQELFDSLNKLGYRSASETAQRLLQLRTSNRYRQLPELSRQRLGKLIPRFITLSARHNDPDITLSRMLLLLEGISRRAAYLAFLAEYPQALERLTKLVSTSSWASDYLTRHPALLDELLDAREIYQSPDWHRLDGETATRLLECSGDLEKQMDVLRHVQQEQTFHLLAMDLQGLLPLEILSDQLSMLADLVLTHVLNLCWKNSSNHTVEQPHFAIIAYGKLGGRELGYASDLDLIFLYENNRENAQEIYARLAQRINTMLSSYTAAGRLYETDLRLRPNGASGLLVSSVTAFADYQRNQAWVWEHQALTRARFSAGDSAVGKAFEKIRMELLCQPRDRVALRKEVLEMRQKIHDGHVNNSDLFDIKHGKGGMVDIEFMVQYLVLVHAHQYPGLAENVGNLALLKLAAELNLLSADLAARVGNLYRTLRQIQHRMRLNNHLECRIPFSQVDTTAGQQLWQQLFGEPSDLIGLGRSDR